MASSPRGDITGSTYTDLGATTPEALAISTRSREFARQEIGNETLEDRVRQRCAIAVGDIAMADCSGSASTRWRRASPPSRPARRSSRTSGWSRSGSRSEVTPRLSSAPSTMAADRAVADGITRTSAGFLALGDRLEGAIIVIGNAPSALLALCGLDRERACRPALVVGTPVGFVNAAESKALLRTLDIPSISNEGTRGGTPVAVAAMNEIITIFAERQA